MALHIDLENKLRCVAPAYLGQNDDSKALLFYNQALPAFREAGDRNGETMTLLDAGVVYLEMGDPQKALDSYGQALLISRQLG